MSKSVQKLLEDEKKAETLQEQLEDKEQLLSEFQLRLTTLETELQREQLRAFNAETMVRNMQQSEEDALQRAFESESNLVATLQQMQRLEIEAKHKAEVEEREALKAVEMELQHARKLTNLAERRATRAEEDLLELRGRWALKKAEIHFTDEVIEVGASALIKKATFRGAPVAVKVYSSQISSRYVAYYQQISREMEMVANLRHPNLVQFIGASLEEEFIIVSELMATDLRKMITNGSITPAHVHNISQDIICALNYLHLLQPNPIIHKDIKSDNVLLYPFAGNHWKAKVSNVYSVPVSTSSPYTIYDAPEASNPPLHSPKMDIYSFGVVLVEMLTGKYQPSYSRKDLIALVDPESHAQYYSIVQQCLYEDRHSRPSAQDIFTQL